MSDCVTGKVVYTDEALAIEALIQYHIRNGREVGGPTNVYRCEDCGSWHFTSQGKHESLENTEIKKYIEKERLAYYWERKTR